MFEEEYQLQLWKDLGFTRNVCKSCGTAFWALDPNRDTCGDTPCVDYTFIDNPPIKKKHTIGTLRESFLDFFEKRGHTRMSRYPVVARWRDDIYLTIASIADFQPHVTSGEVPPPANPLVISQPCIRMADLDSIGRSGRHLSTFEMMGHHAFSSPDKHIYWKEEAMGYCHEFFTKTHGIPEDLMVYREDPWVGGGNAGPAMEIMCEGLEVATLVFMCMKQDDDGPLDVKGDKYRYMDMKVVDPGYGLERIVWASQGTPTLYDAIYPEMTKNMFEMKDLQASIDNNHDMLVDYAKICGIIDFEGEATLMKFREELSNRLNKAGHDTTPKKLHEFITPIENVYTLIDHAKCLAFMLGDGIVPSNSKAGYLARLIIRRSLRLIEELELDMTLPDLVQEHISRMPEYPDLQEHFETTKKILEIETERYHNTLVKGQRIIKNFVKTNNEFTVDKYIEFYDRNGIHPSIVEKVATDMGIAAKVPDNFSTQLAKLHAGAKKEKKKKTMDFDLPKTNMLFYTNPTAKEFDSTVLYCKDGKLVLAESAFYPEGGGQDCDHGVIVTENETLKVTDVQKYDGVVVHFVEKDIPVGEMVKGVIDWERRMSLQRNHTATHIILGAARKVLGEHVWQAGAKKTAEWARLDITHYKKITEDELRRIEWEANEATLGGIPMERTWMDREEAEKKYGFRLYEGGIPPGKKLRVVRIGDFDVEACAGTHCSNTQEAGFIKILGSERIADGVERLEFAAGKAALKHLQTREGYLYDSCRVFGVLPEQLPMTTERFFTEWKDRGKEIDKLQKECSSGIATEAKKVGDVSIISLVRDTDRKGMVSTAQGAIGNPKTVVCLAAPQEGSLGILIARSPDVDLHCGDALRAAAEKLGAKGGGKPDFAQGGAPGDTDPEEAITKMVETVESMLQ